MRVKIDRFGINGEGIAKLDNGKLVFIKNALPDETVEIDIIEDNSRYCIGELKEIYSKSKDRVVPKCKYFSICGGCDLQHINKSAQIELKKKSVKDTIKKIASLDVNITDFVYGDEFNYRNKMVFPIGSKDGRAFVGMFRGESKKVVEIDNCLLAKDNINKIIGIISEYIRYNYAGYDFEQNKGDIKYLVIRENNNNAIVTIVATKKVDLKQLYDILCKHIKNVGISLIISNNNDEILSGKYYHLYGLAELQLSEHNIHYSLDNRGFMQVNDEIKEKLYSKVLSYIGSEDNVLDAYSGAGLLTAIISKKCKTVTGIEINKSACESAKNLIKRNNLINIEYYEGNVKSILPKCITDDISVVVLDPPRSGCDKKVLEILNNAKSLNRIIYISCNPATLARDLNILKEHFEITELILFEMFAGTKHVEACVVLKRNK